MEVKFVDYPKQHAKYKDEIESAILRICNSRARILQDEVRKFEENLAEFIGVKYAVGLNSGTDALFLSLKCLGIGQDDEVITVGHTFHATVEAIKWNGAKPVLVDIGEDGLIDPIEVRKAITSKTKAIVPVHLEGKWCGPEVFNIAYLNKLKIVEDAAQALGSRWNDENCIKHRPCLCKNYAGSYGDAGCFSFFPAKILGAYGDAGAVTTNNESLYIELKNMREHYKYSEIPKYGFNSRLDELQAAILNVKFKYLPDMISRRQEIADLYFEGLKDLEKIGKIKLPAKSPGRVYQDWIMRTDKRDELFQFLQENGIETLKNDYHFPIPKPEATVKLESQTLRLPCNDVLEDEEAKYVIERINKFYEM